MDTTPTVRKATREDCDTLVAFNQAMAQETEDKLLAAEVVSPGVEGLFDRPDHGFYLVAERDDTIVGSLMVTPEWSDWRDGFFWWIQSVYVRPEARKTGVYRSLYDAVLRRAEATGGICGVRLYVERDNAAARAVYERLGMEETPYRLYEVSLSPRG